MKYTCGGLSNRECDSTEFVRESRSVYCKKCIWHFPSATAYKILLLSKKGVVILKTDKNYLAMPRVYTRNDNPEERRLKAQKNYIKRKKIRKEIKKEFK